MANLGQKVFRTCIALQVSFIERPATATVAARKSSLSPLVNLFALLLKFRNVGNIVPDWSLQQLHRCTFIFTLLAIVISYLSKDVSFSYKSWFMKLRIYSLWTHNYIRTWTIKIFIEQIKHTRLLYAIIYTLFGL